MRTAKKTFWIVGALLALALLAIPKIVSSRQTREKPAGQAQAAQRVRIHEAAPRKLEDRLVVHGTLLGEDAVELRSEITGRVASIEFKDGAEVEKGKLLVKLDDSEMKANLVAMEYQVSLAEREEARQQSLLKSGGAAQQTYDQAANELKVLRAQRDAMGAQIDKTELRAPFAGTVGLRQVSEGSLIEPSTPITTLQKVEALKIDFPVAERYQGGVREGMAFRLAVAGLEEEFEGEVAAIEPRIDPVTRTILLRGRVPNPEGKLRPGGFATVSLVMREIPDAIMIPSTALIPELDRQTLFVVEEGKAAQRTVEIGLRLETEVQVLSGIEPGERVVIDGVQGLCEGRPVEVIGEAPEARAQRDARS